MSGIRAALPFLAALLAPAALSARVCPMCYQAAANSSMQFFDALKHGILFMMMGPLVITGGIVYIAYRKRNQFIREAPASDADLCQVVESWKFSD